jgi:hypothetical protein
MEMTKMKVDYCDSDLRIGDGWKWFRIYPMIGLASSNVAA